MGGGSGDTTSTTHQYQDPAVGYWTNQELSRAAPYFLGNTQMPANLNAQTAGFSPAQLGAMSQILGLGGPAMQLTGSGTNFLESLLGGGSPAPNISSIMGGQGLGGTNQMLANTISGQYLNPSTNPYLQDTFNQAAKGVTDQYNLATAPSLMAEGEIASGGGPGAFANSSAANQQQWANQYGLGQNLNNLATDIYGGNYQQERDRQMGAASQAIGLGESQAGFNQQGVNQQLTGLGMLPSTQQALYQPAQESLGVGQMQQQQQQNVLDTLFQNAMRSAQWPQLMYSGLGGLLGQLGAGSGTTISTSPSMGAMK